MKKIFVSVLALVCAVMVISCNSNSTITKGNTAKLDSLSYCLGANIGSGIKQQLSDIPFDLNVVTKAMQEGLTQKSKQTQEEAIEILREFFSTTLNERREAIAAQKADSTSTATPATIFDTEEECEAISYAFGNDIGNNVRESKFPIQYHWLLKGFRDAYEGSTELSQEQIMTYLQRYFMVIRPAEAAERSAKWLAKKEKSFGVKKTESGLLYKVVDEGDMSAAATSDEDTVEVHYVGKLQDGTVFDASRFENRSKAQQEMMRAQRPDMFDENGNLLNEEPIKFPLNRVIAGWTEGMKLIGPGGKIILYIPAELAYGQRGAGRDIGPNEALEFEVELLSVEPVAKEEAPAEAATEAPAEKK